MKKLVSTVLILALSAMLFCSCQKAEETDVSSDFLSINPEVFEWNLKVPDAVPDYMKPDVKRIKSICVWATNKVYFHNIAKATKDKGTYLNAFGKEDRKFWVEYSGTAEIGIDMSQVQMIVEGDKITIQMPHSKLLSDVQIDSASYTSDSYITENDSYGKRNNEIKADDITRAVAEANLDMKKQIMNDRNLMINADQKAQELIENYIKKISAKSNINYKVEFHYIDELPNSNI